MARISKGSVIIETALVLPLLIILLFGMIQLGSFFYMRHNLLEIAYNGVRIAATNPNSTNASVQSYIEQQLGNIGLSQAQIMITPDNFTSSDRGSFLKVVISVDASLLVLIPFPLNLAQTQISVSASMIKEY